MFPFPHANALAEGGQGWPPHAETFQATVGHRIPIHV
jgi:hypothetical protein